MPHQSKSRSQASRRPHKPRAIMEHRKPSEEKIRKRAFEIYAGRNGSGGDQVSDWLQAERELAS